MALAAQNGKLIFKELQVNLALLYQLLVYDLHRKLRVCVNVSTLAHLSEGPHAQEVSLRILLVYVLDIFEFLVIIHAKCFLVRLLFVNGTIIHLIWGHAVNLVYSLSFICFLWNQFDFTLMLLTGS